MANDIARHDAAYQFQRNSPLDLEKQYNEFREGIEDGAASQDMSAA